MKEIIAADLETFIINHKNYNEHIVYAVGWKNINTNKEYIEYIENTGTVKEDSYKLISRFMNKLFEMNSPVVYFHNMSGFDGIFLLKWAKLRGLGDKVKILSRNTIILKIKIDNVEFRDSYRIMPSSLDNLAKSLLGESKLDFDHRDIKSIQNCIDMRDKVEEYLRKDVDILARVIFKSSANILKEFNINLFDHLTTASLSLAIYKLTNKEHIETIEQSKGEKDKFIRNGYNGGLCNLIFPDLKNGYCYDVNSLYPYIMSTCKVPIGEGVWINSIKNFEEIKGMFGFIEVEVETEYPCLAVDYEHKGLITPIGKFSGTFFSEELKFALKNGCKVIKFKKALVYKEKRVIFRKFINNMYSKRVSAKKRGDSINAYNLKLIMNSLYGRFGLGTDKSIMEFIDDEDYKLYKYIYHVFSYEDGFISFVIHDVDISKKNFEDWCYSKNIKGKKKEKLYDRIVAKYLKGNSPYRAVQISAAISSYARVKMMSDIHYCFDNNIEVSYIDTDSLFVNKPLPKELVSEKKLGKYKLESIIDEAVFLAPKAYAYKSGMKEVIKLKGVEKDKKKIGYEVLKNIRNEIREDIKKKWKFNYVKPVFRLVNKLLITDKNQNLELGFESYKFIRVYDKNGVWVACSPPRLN